MSPSSSSTPQPSGSMPPPKSTHSRNVSAMGMPSKAPSRRPSPIRPKSHVHYTCFIRLPFPRGDFEDPPPVEWDAVKDRKLWKLISTASNSKDLDWEEIAMEFDVGLAFLLQQAAWLYERHFEGMRKQMQKLGASQTPSPAPPESGNSSGITATGASMQRKGSKDSPRLPPAINTLKSASSAGDGNSPSPGTPRSAHPPMSRTPSTTTVTQSRMLAGSGRQPVQRAFRGSSGSQKRPTAPASPSGMLQDDDDEYVLGHDGPSDSASEEEPPSRSQAFRRTAPAKKPALKTLSSEDDEGESSGGYLPFAAAASGKPGKDDPAATLKGVSRHPAPLSHHQTTATKTTKRNKPDPLPSESSASSASSAQHQLPSTSDSGAASQARPGPLSPKHRAQLVNLSPRSRRDGSEGSPSMGSSFSDLDEASVTQSALEEALLSNIQGGNLSSIGSRIGSLREVLGRK